MTLSALLLGAGCGGSNEPIKKTSSDASNPDSNESGSTDLAQEGTVCSATASFTATGSSTGVVLSWAGAPGVTYTVFRKTYCSTDDYVSLATLPAGSTSYDDTTANANWVYWYKLTATDGSDHSVAVAAAAQAAENGVAACSAGATVADSGVDPNACVVATPPDAGTDGGPPSVSCTGTLSSLTVSPASLPFGSETIGEGSTRSLLTIVNGGSAAVSPGTIGLAGAAPGDYTIENDCPASLPAGDKCYARISFKPTATGSRAATVSIGGSCSTPITGTGVALADGFYVAPTGSDSGDGSIDHPFSSLTKAQSAMQASGGAKLVTYLRGGLYKPANIASCGCALNLGAADNGETWSYYPPDGVDSAILDGGGSSSSSPGINNIIVVGGASKITLNGITVQNFGTDGVNGYGSTDIVIKNSVAAHGYTQNGYGAQGFACYGVCNNWSILNNVMHDVTGGGANVVSGANTGGGNISGLIYSGNVVYNTCTATPDNGDCGALYTQDNVYKSTNITIVGNYVKDGNPFLNGSNGSGIYLDDCLSNATVSGNILTGNNGSNTSFLHAGKNDLYIGNIFDVGPSAQHISTWQTSANPYCAKGVDPDFMTNNKYTGNIIISKAGTSYSDLTYPNTVTPTVDSNVYYSYGGDTINVGPEKAAVLKDPQLSGCYDVAPSSPAWGIGFSALLQDWGPPGYKLPSGGTEPSYPSPTCY